MNNIGDLHVKKEIVPLFDFVGNEISRDMLIDLLTDFPTSVAGIVERQEILKSFLRCEPVLVPMPYASAEFKEIQSYMEEVRNRDLRIDAAAIRFSLLFAKVKRHRERGRLVQLFIFLYKIERAWFVHIKAEDFPAAFAGMIVGIQGMLSWLEVEKYQAIARDRAYDLGEVSHLLARIYEKTSNGEMEKFWKGLFCFEAYLSIAAGIRRHRFNFPVFGTVRFEIQDLYHPLLKGAVKNSLLIKENVNLITGPNMSGKSTLLKSLGLCVVLAHLGLAVPAAACELPYFDQISVTIDLHDDLRSGYSHFMQEVVTLKNIVTAASKGRTCFAIFDELFRGTNVDDAVAISKTTIAGLTHFAGGYFFISTHLQQLKEDPRLFPGLADKIGTRYIECTLDGGQPVFTYKLREGWSDLRIGQLIFELEGLNALLRHPG